MDNEARMLLEDVISFCLRDEREARLINMLEQCEAIKYDEKALAIRTPSRFAYSYLIKQRDLIERYLEEITFAPTALDVAPIEQESEDVTSTVAPARVIDSAPSAPQYEAAEMQNNDVASHQAPATAVKASLNTENGAISVPTTVSADDFKRMMLEMRSNEPQAQEAPKSANTSISSNEENYACVDINAKFTFENFVFGDENKHAYQSALRFAAFADEPGQCTSLFIYGNSGLGKTHLLFAIKNYLMAEKPHIRVKYANSQAYFEDYLQELGARKGPGERIMQDYHAADILIIDDIQNILGREQTVANFFQLMDEFIRSGKKIVIASDRAPKDLNFDERLTSRFNHGMLCLVSEPGFEMKYTILKRYYENNLCGTPDLTGMNVDVSLLSKLHINEGRLTDEQLRHMAEISGNNIRSLESFCERCATRAAERETEGRELTAEDIDSIAGQYFNTARKIIHVGTVQRVVEDYYRVSHEDIIGPRRTANIAWARHVAVYLANNLCEMTTPAIGEKFGGRDHSTVLNSLKVVEKKMKEDRQIYEDLQALKDKIILKS
ncbi:DnaA ATPase domain-containing protein [Collinsella provencensis]|uniref:DnaA ATPase domain-containing protein n=1 Tax=Collinsella provencensis TaxID=1937461 RepID=UPI000C84C8BC|nr:DnaA/Hda family protein [Collinsella provencensis]